MPVHEPEIDEAKRNAACEKAWNVWRNDRLVKATINSFETEDDDVFETLLRDAFNKGFAHGGASAVIHMLDLLLDKDAKEAKSD